MAIDLAAGVLLLTALSVLSYIVGRRVRLGHVSHWFVTSLLISLWFAWGLSGKLAWATVVPSPTVVVWSNLMPILLSFAAGLGTTATTLAHLSRPAAVSALLVLAAAYALTPYTRHLLAPVGVDSQSRWSGGVCLQTHPSTCAPAAAVTLLKMGGIEATECEMAASCLTSTHGTETLGLYRGLAMAAGASTLAPRVAISNPDEWFTQEQLPNIALVRLHQPSQGSPRSSNVSPRRSPHRLLGPRSEGHAVVVLGRDRQGNWMIADPAFGKTKWTDEQFRSRFTGDAIYLADVNKNR